MAWAHDLAVAGFGTGWLRAAFATSLFATIIVIVAVVTQASTRIDEWALDALRLRVAPRPDGKPRRLTTAARDLTALGGDTLRLLFLLVAVVALGCAGRWRVAAALVTIFAAARLVLAAIKALIRRPRPPAADETLTTYTTSFPSGHTFMAGVLYLSAAILIPTGEPTSLVQAAVAAALILSLSIGLTRVSFGIHWPSDVAVGWLASIAWTTGCVLLIAWTGCLT